MGIIWKVLTLKEWVLGFKSKFLPLDLHLVGSILWFYLVWKCSLTGSTVFSSFPVLQWKYPFVLFFTVCNSHQKVCFSKNIKKPLRVLRLFSSFLSSIVMIFKVPSKSNHSMILWLKLLKPHFTNYRTGASSCCCFKFVQNILIE